MTYEFRLPPPDVAKDQPPQLGINFKWATQPPSCDSSSRSYAEIPGLYVDSLLPDGLVMQHGRKSLLPGDRLVGVNGENLEGLNSKVSYLSSPSLGINDFVSRSSQELFNCRAK